MVFTMKGVFLKYIRRLSGFKSEYISKYFFWKSRGDSSVSMKLNVVNFLVIISGFLSIVGAYEIQWVEKCMN
jgi:hypothetical protein